LHLTRLFFKCLYRRQTITIYLLYQWLESQNFIFTGAQLGVICLSLFKKSEGATIILKQKARVPKKAISLGRSLNFDRYLRYNKIKPLRITYKFSSFSFSYI